MPNSASKKQRILQIYANVRIRDVEVEEDVYVVEEGSLEATTELISERHNRPDVFQLKDVLLKALTGATPGARPSTSGMSRKRTIADAEGEQEPEDDATASIHGGATKEVPGADDEEGDRSKAKVKRTKRTIGSR